MFGEDYQVFLPDGRAVGQVLVLGRGERAAGGKRGCPSHFIPLHPTSKSNVNRFYPNALFSESVPPLQKPRSPPPGLTSGPLAEIEIAWSE